MKKIAAVLLAVLMIVGAMPVQVWAVGSLPSNDPQVEMGNGVVASGDCGNEGDNVVWVLYSDGTLVISGTGEMKDSYFPWSSYKDEITTVIIPDDVAHIGEWAFGNCPSLTSVIISDSVTSIGNSAFRNCAALKSVEIGNGVTSIGAYAFEDCTALKSVAIGDGVTSIGDYTFHNCCTLENVVLPDGVQEIGNLAFYGCSAAFTDLILPKELLRIGGMAFRGCTSLKSIRFPSKLTKIGGAAFYECISLEEVSIPESVQVIWPFAFYGCASLKSVTIPEGVKRGLEAFFNCPSLESVTFPKSIQPIPTSPAGSDPVLDPYDNSDDGCLLYFLALAAGNLNQNPYETVLYGYTGSGTEQFVEEMRSTWGLDLQFVPIDASEPETPPDAPETKPDAPEAPPIEAEAVTPLPDGLEILVTEVPAAEKAVLEAAARTMIPAMDDMKVVYADIALVETASQDEKHDRSVTVLIKYPEEIAAAWMNYDFTVIHGAVQSDGSISPEIVPATRTAAGLVYTGTLSPFLLAFKPKQTGWNDGPFTPSGPSGGNENAWDYWHGTGAGSNPLATQTGADHAALAVTLVGLAAGVLGAGAARVRRRK